MNNELLKQITDKLGQNSEELFRLAIRQNYFMAGLDILTGLIFLIGIIIVLKMMKWKTCYKEFNWLKFGLIIMFGIVALICFIYAIYRFFNPQYQAFVDIMSNIIPQQY